MWFLIYLTASCSIIMFMSKTSMHFLCGFDPCRMHCSVQETRKKKKTVKINLSTAIQCSVFIRGRKRLKERRLTSFMTGWTAVNSTEDKRGRAVHYLRPSRFKRLVTCAHNLTRHDVQYAISSTWFRTFEFTPHIVFQNIPKYLSFLFPSTKQSQHHRLW